MRSLKEYNKYEWILLTPLAHVYKQARNDIISRLYTRHTTDNHQKEICKINQSTNANNIIISITFGRTRLTELQIKQFKKFNQDSLLIIADNSPTTEGKNAIEKTCRQENIHYFSLPKNRSTHANRSHSLALQWCYKNIISQVHPEIFGFIDHDIIPTQPFNITNKQWSIPIYGLVWNSSINKAWQLWAGYCFFNYRLTKNKNLNFMYDFANGLDTGGRNYSYFKTLNRSSIPNISNIFAYSEHNNKNYKFQIIDECWVHMGGAGHKQDYKDRFSDFTDFISLLNNNPKWSIENHFFNKIKNIIH